jgi:hypothetical protein
MLLLLDLCSFGKPNLFFFLIAGMIGMGAMMNWGLVVFLRVW